MNTPSIPLSALLVAALLQVSALNAAGETPVSSRVASERLRERQQQNQQLINNGSTAFQSSGGLGADMMGSVSNLTERTDRSFSRLNEAGNLLEIRMALVEPIKEVTISAGIQGNLTRLRVNRKDPVTGEELPIEVREGVNVSEGEEIGTIYEEIELRQIAAAQALLRVAIAEQNKTIEIEYAKASLTVAVAEEERNRLMNERTPHTVSAQMVLEAKLRRVQAEKQHERALYDLHVIKPAETEVKEAELAIAETRLEQRRLVSPINGIVDEIYGHEGMWFREGSEILKITQYDTLLVKGKVNINHVSPRMIDGKTAAVTVPQMGREPEQTFTGRVAYVSQTIEGDDYFKIHVEVKNQLKDGYWLLNPGRYVNLQIQL